MIKGVVRSHGFEIIEQIGAGGFGVIYRAHQPTVGRDVAIKVILSDFARDPLYDKRFEKDARLAAQLEQSDGVPLHDYWQEEESAYLVLHCMRGGTLEETMGQEAWEMAWKQGLFFAS